KGKILLEQLCLENLGVGGDYNGFPGRSGVQCGWNKIPETLPGPGTCLHNRKPSRPQGLAREPCETDLGLSSVPAMAEHLIKQRLDRGLVATWSCWGNAFGKKRCLRRTQAGQTGCDIERHSRWVEEVGPGVPGLTKELEEHPSQGMTVCLCKQSFDNT